MSADPFSWDDNDEDEVRAACECGWAGPWRDFIGSVRDDEHAHECELAEAWRAAE